MENFHNFHVNDGIQKRQSVMRLSHQGCFMCNRKEASSSRRTTWRKFWRAFVFAESLSNWISTSCLLLVSLHPIRKSILKSKILSTVWEVWIIINKLNFQDEKRSFEEV